MLASIRNPENRAVWQLRLYYLLFFGGLGFLFPFLNLFYRRQGLTGTDIGLLGSLAASGGIGGGPFMGPLE